MKCVSCGQDIPTERLEILPGTQHCVLCADAVTPKLKGFMVYSHKTAPEICIVSSRDGNSMRLAKRANKRCR